MEERILMAIGTTTDNHLVGLEIADVKRALRHKYEDIFPIPRTSEEVLGLVHENKVTFPVFDLARLLSTTKVKVTPLSETNDYVAIIVTSLHGYQVGLAVGEDPDFYVAAELSEDIPEQVFSSRFQVKSSEVFVDIIDMTKLFPNVEVIGSSMISESGSESENDDLDMSQYVLTD